MATITIHNIFPVYSILKGNDAENGLIIDFQISLLLVEASFGVYRKDPWWVLVAGNFVGEGIKRGRRQSMMNEVRECRL